VINNNKSTTHRNACTRRVSCLAKPVDDDDVDDEEEEAGDVRFVIGAAVVVVVAAAAAGVNVGVGVAGMVLLLSTTGVIVVNEIFDPFLDNVDAAISLF